MQLEAIFLTCALFSYSATVKFTSYILGQNEKYHNALESMVSEVAPNNSKWARCYHAKSDGFTAHDFHSRCDNKGPTVTLVRVREFVFGGFLDQNWGGKNAVNAFIDCTRKPITYLSLSYEQCFYFFE